MQPSSRARRWRWVGLAIFLCAFVALLAAAVAADPFDWIAAALAAGAGVVAWFAVPRRPTGPFEVGVSDVGRVELRECKGATSGIAEDRPVQVAFASTWLISLRRGTMLIAIWPDSLPQSRYRQLWVHLRWGRAMPSDADPRAGPINHANQTDR